MTNLQKIQVNFGDMKFNQPFNIHAHNHEKREKKRLTSKKELKFFRAALR